MRTCHYVVLRPQFRTSRLLLFLFFFTEHTNKCIFEMENDDVCLRSPSSRNARSETYFAFRITHYNQSGGVRGEGKREREREILCIKVSKHALCVSSRRRSSMWMMPRVIWLRLSSA